MLPAIILRPVRIGARARRRMIPVTATMVAAFNLMAQTESGYIIRTAPYPVFTYPEPAQYNLKFGRMTARLRSSFEVEFNDNINLSDESPEADVSIGPFVGIGFLWPLNLEHVLQLDLGFGYRWYFNHPAIQSVTVAPNSRFDYRIFIKDVKINLHDNISVQVDPTTRPELGGGRPGGRPFSRPEQCLGFHC